MNVAFGRISSDDVPNTLHVTSLLRLQVGNLNVDEHRRSRQNPPSSEKWPATPLLRFRCTLWCIVDLLASWEFVGYFCKYLYFVLFSAACTRIWSANRSKQLWFAQTMASHSSSVSRVYCSSRFWVFSGDCRKILFCSAHSLQDPYPRVSVGESWRISLLKLHVCCWRFWCWSCICICSAEFLFLHESSAILHLAPSCIFLYLTEDTIFKDNQVIAARLHTNYCVSSQLCGGDMYRLGGSAVPSQHCEVDLTYCSGRTNFKVRYRVSLCTTFTSIICVFHLWMILLCGAGEWWLVHLLA